MISNQRAILELTRATRSRTGNLPPLPAIYPDAVAAVVAPVGRRRARVDHDALGMPGPKQYGGPVTNIRNTRSPHWRRWLVPAHRCLVPVTSFSEWEDTKLKKTPMWFALSEEQPLFAFAGIWTRWTGTRGPKSAPVEGGHELQAPVDRQLPSAPREQHPIDVEEQDGCRHCISPLCTSSFQRPLGLALRVLLAR
jgi:putative SOS response-associated peptidase YedK